MSIQAVAWALEQDLPARPKLVLVSIANHADHTSGYCWLKADTIAAEAACTPRSVYRFVGGLYRNGYLRKATKKGEDGKQRATDYWLMFHREEKPWDWGAIVHGDDAGEASAISDEGDADTPDIDEPHEAVSYGETASPHDSPVIRQEPDIPAVSCGPYDSRVSRERIAEPSKTNPKESSARANPPAIPRSYRPPPVEPQAAVVAEGKQIFVYEGSRAYEAWVDFKKRTTGRSFSLATTTLIDGKARRGWWFPSLFPPSDGTQATGPPKVA